MEERNLGNAISHLMRNKDHFEEARRTLGFEGLHTLYHECVGGLVALLHAGLLDIDSFRNIKKQFDDEYLDIVYKK